MKRDFGMEERMKKNGWQTAGILIAALLLYEIGKLAGVLVAQLLFPDSGEGAGSLLMQLAGGGLVYLVWRKDLCAGKGKPAAGKAKIRLTVLWMLLLSVTSSMGLNLLLALSRLTVLSGSFQKTAAAQAAVPVWMGIVLYGFAAPFSEEVLFRGIFYRRVEEAFRGKRTTDLGLGNGCAERAAPEGAEEEGRAVWAQWAAAAASSLMFAIYHGNPVQGIYAFLIGMLLCLVYERTGRLAAAVFFHGAGNLAVYLLIDVAGIGEYLSVGGAAGLCILLLAAAAVCLKPCLGAGQKYKGQSAQPAGRK